MKKKIIRIYLLIFLIPIVSQAQQMQKIWETTADLKTPASVFFDERNQRMYVSNIEGKGLWEKDGKGSISLVTASGKILNPSWVKGLHAPKGMGMYQEFLLVVDVDSVAIIDVIKAQVIKKVYVEDAQGMNDLTTDRQGNMYISDTKAGKIFYIDAGKLKPEVYLSGLTSPDGVLYADRTLYFLDAGVLYKVGKGKEKIKIAEGLPTAADGLVQFNETTLLVTAADGAVFLVDDKGALKKLDNSAIGLKGGADPGWNPKTGMLYLPTFSLNNVVALQIK